MPYDVVTTDISFSEETLCLKSTDGELKKIKHEK